MSGATFCSSFRTGTTTDNKGRFGVSAGAVSVSGTGSIDQRGTKAP